MQIITLGVVTQSPAPEFHDQYARRHRFWRESWFLRREENRRTRRKTLGVRLRSTNHSPRTSPGSNPGRSGGRWGWWPLQGNLTPHEDAAFQVTHQESLTEFKGAWVLSCQLVNTVQPLQEHRAALIVIRVKAVTTSISKPMSKFQPLAFNQNLKALEEKDIWWNGEVTGEWREGKLERERLHCRLCTRSFLLHGFSKPWPYFRPKYTIFHTPFQTLKQSECPWSMSK